MAASNGAVDVAALPAADAHLEETNGEPRERAEEDARPAAERVRFVVELEFVQCLGNPHYLHHLAQNLYLEDERFMAYLAYLRAYWRRPRYAQYLTYPACLDVLDLVLSPHTDLERLKDPAMREMMHEQQFYAWMYGSD